MKNVQKTTKWQYFTRELSNLLFFWFFGALFFLVFRITFITLFNKKIHPETSVSEIGKALWMGFRFDCTAISYFLILPLLGLLLLSLFGKFDWIRKIRKVHQFLFLFCSTLICMITLNYFKEYNDQFNNFIFLAFYDDQKAVMKTVWEDFHPILNIFLFIVVILIGIFIFRHFAPKRRIEFFLNRLQSIWTRTLLVLGILVLFVVNIRGSFTAVPATRKWAGVTSDAFLNKTIINPYRSLKYAYRDFSDLNLIEGKNPYLNQEEFQKHYSQQEISAILKKETSGATIEKPNQLFLIIMESYDAWPLMSPYSQLGLADNLKQIASEGTLFTDFIPASYATFNSFGAIVTGVPYCGVNINKLGTINKPFETSIFRQFKKLGYTGNLFYGGFPSWQNIGNFSLYHGANRIFSGTDAGGDDSSGDWGVEDEKLFDMVLNKTAPNKSSMNVILTSSYHPPYTVPIYEKGFPYKKESDLPEASKSFFKNAMTFEEMGHLWYSDQAIGNFVRAAQKKFPNALFCFTGDHYGRRFVNHHPNLYERSAVNFILYGKNIPKAVHKTPGTHVDIIPTLIELVAPKGFNYYSFGSSLLKKEKRQAVGLDKIINANSLFQFEADATINQIDLSTFQENSSKNKELFGVYKKFMGLAWHYTVKGDKIVFEKKEK